MSSGRSDWQIVIGPHLPTVHRDMRRAFDQPLVIIGVILVAMVSLGLLLVVLAESAGGLANIS